MKFKTLFAFGLIAACAVTVTAGTTSKVLADEAIAVWGSQQAFDSLGILKLEVTEDDSLPDGTRQTTAYTLYYDTTTDQRRLELGQGKVVIVSDNASGWATTDGKLDDRAQTAHLAPRFVNMKLMPALLPFSLTLRGVGFTGQASPTSFEGTPALPLEFYVPNNFFNSPFVNTRWTAFVAEDDHHYLGAEFLPVTGYENNKNVKNSGMRFRVTETTSVKGVRFATTIIVESLDKAGKATGSRRTMKIRATVVEDSSPLLFLHPDKVRAFDED